MTPPTVHIDEAARLLQVSRRTVYTRIREGRLVTVKAGTSQRVTLESLRDELERLNRPTPRGPYTGQPPARSRSLPAGNPSLPPGRPPRTP